MSVSVSKSLTNFIGTKLNALLESTYCANVIFCLNLSLGQYDVVSGLGNVI